MNYFKKILISFFILISVNLVFSQIKDSNELKNTDFLNKGKFAVVFELGTLISKGSFFEGYNFLAKYHISEKSALRVNFKIGEGEQGLSGIGSSALLDYSSYDYDVNINFQYYLSKKSFIKPFISFGPTYFRSFFNVRWENSDFRWKYERGIGLTFTLGTEVFLYNNVSLIGEYLLRGVYALDETQYYQSGYYVLSSKITNREFIANTARLGFSVYF